jgi:hypothetical protein
MEILRLLIIVFPELKKHFIGYRRRQRAGNSCATMTDNKGQGISINRQKKSLSPNNINASILAGEYEEK